jgi:hypothetical protein
VAASDAAREPDQVVCQPALNKLVPILLRNTGTWAPSNVAIDPASSHHHYEIPDAYMRTPLVTTTEEWTNLLERWLVSGENVPFSLHKKLLAPKDSPRVFRPAIEGSFATVEPISKAKTTQSLAASQHVRGGASKSGQTTRPRSRPSKDSKADKGKQPAKRAGNGGGGTGLRSDDVPEDEEEDNDEEKKPPIETDEYPDDWDPYPCPYGVWNPSKHFKCTAQRFKQPSHLM